VVRCNPLFTLTSLQAHCPVNEEVSGGQTLNSGGSPNCKAPANPTLQIESFGQDMLFCCCPQAPFLQSLIAILDS
jgi:hypothetical protein